MRSVLSGGLLLLLLILVLPVTGQAHEKDDPHYTNSGFFDMHVCNWPDRATFFMVLFSSPRYDTIRAVDVFTPQGKPLTSLDLSRFRLIGPAKKPKKKVFIRQVEVRPEDGSGWYTAHIRLASGAVETARDYVDFGVIGRATGLQPVNHANVPTPPTRLSWQPVAGARFYEVFVHDNWNDGKIIYTSKLSPKPYLDVPHDLLQPGGYYSWAVNARDMNEDVRFGDFNRGSMSAPAEFTVDP